MWALVFLVSTAVCRETISFAEALHEVPVPIKGLLQCARCDYDIGWTLRQDIKSSMVGASTPPRPLAFVVSVYESAGAPSYYSSEAGWIVTYNTGFFNASWI
ncbi:unnamed protein product [Ostreobium quekettii]|uniref:Yippee domain-containing protein n=1 Tax=Ostreobium quekettii TaxID=121088 RepID=A0A8S1JG00_9CHLO|nr:unnamed protein product [Ostreobium quekettii]